MKSKRNLLEQLNTLPHFSKDSLYQLGRQFGLAVATVDTYVSRFLKHKEILPLKNGLYIAADFFNKNKGDISYRFYLANIIRTPSYVSSWSALQFYNLSTETTYGITSVTPKVTRNYQTKVGTFSYQSIKNELFADFSLIQGRSFSSDKPAGKFDFFIASPAKALFDLLYFKTRQFRGVRSREIKGLIEELRIDFTEMNKSERAKFHALIKRHTDHE